MNRKVLIFFFIGFFFILSNIYSNAMLKVPTSFQLEKIADANKQSRIQLGPGERIKYKLFSSDFDFKVGIRPISGPSGQPRVILEEIDPQTYKSIKKLIEIEPEFLESIQISEVTYRYFLPSISPAIPGPEHVYRLSLIKNSKNVFDFSGSCEAMTFPVDGPIPNGYDKNNLVEKLS